MKKKIERNNRDKEYEQLLSNLCAIIDKGRKEINGLINKNKILNKRYRESKK